MIASFSTSIADGAEIVGDTGGNGEPPACLGHGAGEEGEEEREPLHDYCRGQRSSMS